MSWQGIKTQIKIDFFRLLTLFIVLIFLGLTVARMAGHGVDESIYTSWTNVTIAMLPSSGIKESAEWVGRNRQNDRDYSERV